MKYLLDTNVISDIFKRHPVTVGHFAGHPASDLALCTITVFEVEFGLTENPASRSRNAELWNELLSNLTVLEFSALDAASAARVRLQTAAQPIGPSDTLIAGVALARGLTVVTNNTAEFGRVLGLNVVDWRE